MASPEDIEFAARGVEYWGHVPVVARIDDIEFATALLPKDGRYLLPLRTLSARPPPSRPARP